MAPVPSRLAYPLYSLIAKWSLSGAYGRKRAYRIQILHPDEDTQLNLGVFTKAQPTVVK
jgi:hypothetical protein